MRYCKTRSSRRCFLGVKQFVLRSVLGPAGAATACPGSTQVGSDWWPSSASLRSARFGPQVWPGLNLTVGRGLGLALPQPRFGLEQPGLAHIGSAWLDSTRSEDAPKFFPSCSRRVAGGGKNVELVVKTYQSCCCVGNPGGWLEGNKVPQIVVLGPSGIVSVRSVSAWLSSAWPSSAWLRSALLCPARPGSARASAQLQSDPVWLGLGELGSARLERVSASFAYFGHSHICF